jgi:hypothetical protein
LQRKGLRPRKFIPLAFVRRFNEYDRRYVGAVFFHEKAGDISAVRLSHENVGSLLVGSPQ